MYKLTIAVLAAVLALALATLALAQEVLDPNNCAAQGMKVGGGYECAPLDAAVIPPQPEYPAHVYQGSYHWYWYPESGWWYELGSQLYPG
jgi:opacity protein-like surface antigen